MLRKHWYIGIFILILSSCDYFSTPKNDPPQEPIDTFPESSEVKAPLFDTCKTVSLENLQTCFATTFSSHISNYLKDKTVVVQEHLHDTVWMQILINNTGKISLENLILSDSIQHRIPEINSWLQESIIALPEVKPAYVRNQPTSTRYKLPVILKIN